jgi:hypothetical protein
MIDQAAFKKELLKEAKSKLRGVQKTASHRDIVTEMLVTEADQRLHRIKESALQKEAMAQWSTKEQKNARANTVWNIPDKTNRIQQIEQELNDAFAPYFRPLLREVPKLRGQLSQGENLERALNAYFPGNERVDLSDEEEGSTLRMEFEFQRVVVPVASEYADVAQGNVDLMEETVSGFQDFVNAINEHRVPLVPGFGTNLGRGRPRQDQLRNFIESETERGQQASLRTPVGDIPLSKFWFSHMKRINAKEELPKATYQSHGPRAFAPEAALRITYPTYLMRAIQTKIFQGFRLDPAALRKVIRDDVERAIKASKSSARRLRTDPRRIRYELLRHWAQEQENKIIDQYKKAISPPSARDSQREVLRLTESGKWEPATIPAKMVDFGTSNGKAMRGLRMNVPKTGAAVSKNTYCLDMNHKELQYLLYALQKHEPEKVQGEKLDKFTRTIPRNGGFVIPDFSMTYAANGFDSDPSFVSPGMLAPQMPVIPPVLELPNGSVTYNTDHGNLNRNVLVNTGSKYIEAFLSDPRVGEWALRALPFLQEPNPEFGQTRRQFGRRRRTVAPGKNITKLYQKAKQSRDQMGAFETWAKYIGTTDKLGNRTSAETLQEHILTDPNTGQPRNKQQLETFLKGSTASDWARHSLVHEAQLLITLAGSEIIRQLQNGSDVMAFIRSFEAHPESFDKASAKQLLTAIQNDVGVRNLSKGVQSKLRKILTTGGRQPQGAKNISISDNAHQLLQRYGYAVAKMMDFLHALMVRSCEERLIQKYDPDEAKKILEKKNKEREANDLPPIDLAEVPADQRTADDEAHHLSYGRTYSSTTGKNQSARVVFGIKYAFTSPKGSNDPLLTELADRYRRAPRAARPGHGSEGAGTYAVPEGAPDPASGRLTRAPQQGTERPEVFQTPQTARGVLRVVEDMTFWVGYKSSSSGFARTLRGQETRETFDTRLPNTYSYQDALAELKRLYPQLEEDLDLIFNPISLNIEKLKRATDKAMAKIQEELRSMGINVDIAITDPLNRARIIDGEDLGPAAEVEEIMADGSEIADNLQQRPQPETAGTGVAGQPTAPVETVPQTPTTPTVTPQTPVEPQGTPGLPPTPPAGGIEPTEFEEAEEETPNEMPKAFPMQEPGYIGKRKKMKPLVRNGPDPTKAKLRRASSDSPLVSLADRLDEQGEKQLADKLDVLLSILNES